MPVFTFEARTGSGQAQRGTQEAPSAGAVVASLRQRGWLVVTVRSAEDAEGKAIDWLALINPWSWLPPRSLDVELSLQQMATMLRSGLTLLTALRTVAEYAQRKSMRLVWQNVAERIQQGSSLGDAMAQHRCFHHMVLQLVRVGEMTGTLDQVMTRAAETLERRRLLRTQVLTALFYPTVVLVAAIAVTAFMIVGVIPKLRIFLDALGRKLPAMTQALLDVSSVVQAYGPAILIVLFGLTVSLTLLYLTPLGRMHMDRLLLRVPILGLLLRLGATAQFAHGLGVLMT